MGRLARLRGVPKPRPIRVGLTPDAHEVVIANGGELAVLHDILIDEEYAPRRHPHRLAEHPARRPGRPSTTTARTRTAHQAGAGAPDERLSWRLDGVSAGRDCRASPSVW